jgi:hypothetical protein
MARLRSDSGYSSPTDRGHSVYCKIITEELMQGIRKLTCTLLLLWVVPPLFAQGQLSIELNRLETVSGNCRTYLIFKNGTDHTYSDLKLDLVFFDKEGVIAKRMAVDAAPLMRNKTIVKLFDIPGLGCSKIRRILLNDVLTCDNGADDINPAHCLDVIRLANRTDIEFIR